MQVGTSCRSQARREGRRQGRRVAGAGGRVVGRQEVARRQVRAAAAATAAAESDVISMMMLGRNYMATTPADLNAHSSNVVLVGLVRGVEAGFPVPGNAISGRDVATAHVRALDPQVPGNQTFVISTPMAWDDAIPWPKNTSPRPLPTASSRTTTTSPRRLCKVR